MTTNLVFIQTGRYIASSIPIRGTLSSHWLIEYLDISQVLSRCAHIIWYQLPFNALSVSNTIVMKRACTRTLLLWRELAASFSHSFYLMVVFSSQPPSPLQLTGDGAHYLIWHQILSTRIQASVATVTCAHRATWHGFLSIVTFFTMPKVDARPY